MLIVFHDTRKMVQSVGLDTIKLILEMKIKHTIGLADL